MAPILGVAAGAGEGLDTYLQRMILEQELAQRGQAQQETGRHNLAQEAYQTEALKQNNAERLAAAQLAAGGRRDAQNDKEGTAIAKGLDELPDQTIVSPATRSRALNLRAVPPERFGAEQPPIMGKSDPSAPGNGEVGPQDQGFPIVGSAQSKLAMMRVEDAKQAREDAAKNQTDGNYDLPGVGPIVAQKTKDGKILYQGQDVTARVKPHDAPGQPILYAPTGQSPALIDKGSATARPVKGADGNPLDVRQTTGEIDRADSSRKATAVLDSLDKSIDEAASQLGPAAGRMSDFEQWVGSGNPALQRVGTQMLAAKMLVDASIGGMRAAASPQLLARWDNLLANKVTPEGLKAAVQVLREMAVAGGPASKAGTGGKADFIFDPATGTLKPSS